MESRIYWIIPGLSKLINSVFRSIDINSIIRKEEVAPYLPDRDSFNFDENDFNTGDTEFREKYYSTLD